MSDRMSDEGVRKIPLTKGKFAIVDAEDFAWLSLWKWHYGARRYAVHNYYMTPGKKKAVFMHSAVNKTPPGLQTDHINRNPLDNRKCNLRSATNPQNQANRSNYKGKSRYKGVSWGKKENKWRAQIKFKRKMRSLGYYHVEENAALAYNEKAKELFGEFACLNQI